MIPTTTELANLAAIMAKPGEDARTSARRAMELWKACEQEYFREKRRDEETQAEDERQYQEWRDGEDFLEALKPGTSVDGGAKSSVEDRVGLELFLKACSPTSKDLTLLKNWRLFRRFNQIREDKVAGLPPKDDLALSEIIDEIVKRDRLNGLAYPGTLILLRTQFRRFVDDQVAEWHATHAQAMVRARKINDAAKVVISGQAPTPENVTLLKSLSTEEVQKVALNLNLNAKQTEAWKAKVLDLQTPPSGRPKIRKGRSIG